MYSTREAMAYSGKLPEQKNAGITPDLIDLLAMQKVQDDKQAAASQMALAAGQPMPTIAETLKQKALASAKQEIAQKLGLPALAQQQAPQGQAAMPPQAAPQQAPAAPQQAPQGVAAVPSNLPQSYAHGGILHYVGGGEAGMREQVGDVNQLSDSSEEVQQVVRDLQSGKLQGAERQAALGYLQDIAAKSAGGGRGFVNPGMGPSIKDTANQGLNKVNEQAAAYPSAQDQYQLTPAQQAFQEKTMNLLSKRLDLDPDEARAKGEELYKKATQEHFDQAQKGKQEGLAALQALYSKDQEGRPSQFWQTIGAIGAKGPNVLPGQWGAGVAEKVQAQKEAYNATDIARQKSINDLTDSINSALLNNDVSIYNAGKADWIRTQTELGTDAHTAAMMADAQMRNIAARNSAHEQAASRLLAREQGIAATSVAKAAALEEARNRHRIDAIKAAEDEIAKLDKNKEKALESVLDIPSNKEKRDKIERDFQTAQERIYRNFGVPYTPPAATSNTIVRFDKNGKQIS